MKITLITAGLISVTLLTGTTFSENILRADDREMGPSCFRVKSVVANAAEDVLLLKRKSHWSLPAYLGPHHISMYYVLLQTLHTDFTKHSKIDRSELKRLLLRTQAPDGSWVAVLDLNNSEGEIDPTLMNYWALKVMGENPDSTHMVRARHFIIKNGGVPAASLFSKIFLALAGAYPWKKIPQLPNVMFKRWFPANMNRFAQWVTPHLEAIWYLRKYKVANTPGFTFRVDEFLNPEERALLLQEDRDRAVTNLRKRVRDYKKFSQVVEKQQPRGSYGAYTPSTLFTMAMMDDWIFANVNEKGLDLKVRLGNAFYFVESQYFGEDGLRKQEGVPFDGRYWDTALIGQALSEANVPLEKIKDTADLFDESSEDIAGHVLEALGGQGHSVENSKTIRKAIDMQKKLAVDKITWKRFKVEIPNLRYCRPNFFQTPVSLQL